MADSPVRPVIQRASPTDLAFLAMDVGPVPQQMGAVLLLDAGPDFDPAAAEELLGERILAVPRLRQRLVRTPPGCGRAVWVDDPGFDVQQHVRHLHCPPPGDEQTLLDLATAVVTEPLPQSRPLWSAVFVTGLADHTVALVMVLHHVLADGIGGLAVLASLVDQAAHPSAAVFPRRPPTVAQLAADALLERLRGLAVLPRTLRRTRASLAPAGGVRPARIARCSLLQRTGPRRRFAAVRANLAGLRATAHAHGATVNDAVLAAVTGALHMLLEHRGESVETLAVTVPVAIAGSATTGAAADRVGNQVAPMVVVLPAVGDPAQRLRRTAAATRVRKGSMSGPPAIALLGPVFRAAASLRLYHWYLNHQHRFHTLVTNVRGPDRPLTFAGTPVIAVIPAPVAEGGNVTVSFAALSYAGTLTITVLADPDHLPDLPVLTTALQAQLAALASAPGVTQG